MHDAIIIGAGHNAIAAAFYLAKGGRRPLVLERRPAVGGGAATGEIHPGFKCPIYSHEILLDRQVAGDLGLGARGIEFRSSPVQVCAPSLDHKALVLYADTAKTVEHLQPVNAKDAGRYAGFRAAMERAASIVGTTFQSPPPDIDAPTAGDLWGLLKAGRRFRSLGKREGHQLLRWLSMPVGDLVSEWFDSGILRATIAGSAISGTMLGPRSAGSSLVLLLREASLLRAAGRGLVVRGGPGAVTKAMADAATSAGAEIRTDVAVERILVRDQRVVGVIAGGQEITAPLVVSGVDPKTTFLSLLDPMHLEPDFTTRIRNFRASGTVAKVNLALSSLPDFHGVDPNVLTGRLHIGPDLDYLERAFDHVKYGEMSTSPWLDLTIPTLADKHLAAGGGQVASIYVHCAPYRLRDADWHTAKGLLLERTLATLEAYAPRIRSLVVAAKVLTPADLEAELGLSGGHIFHGELSLDQAFTMRPLLGHAGYDSPIRGLYLCGAGTHPGGFMTGVSGRLAARVILKRAASA